MVSAHDYRMFECCVFMNDDVTLSTRKKLFRGCVRVSSDYFRIISLCNRTELFCMVVVMIQRSEVSSRRAPVGSAAALADHTNHRSDAMQYDWWM